MINVAQLERKGLEGKHARVLMKHNKDRNDSFQVKTQKGCSTQKVKKNHLQHMKET